MTTLESTPSDVPIAPEPQPPIPPGPGRPDPIPPVPSPEPPWPDPLPEPEPRPDDDLHLRVVHPALRVVERAEPARSAGQVVPLAGGSENDVRLPAA